MSLLPRVLPVQRKYPSRPKNMKKASGGELLVLPRLQGNDDSCSPSRARTATLRSPKVLHAPPTTVTRASFFSKIKSSTLKMCHFCGREFGSASVDIHEKYCQQKLLTKHAGTLTESTKYSKYVDGHAKPSQPNPVDCSMQDFKPRRSTNTERHSWEPFSVKCQYCNEKFGRHSIAIHEKRCLQRVHSDLEDPQIPSGTRSSISKPLEVETFQCRGFSELPPRPLTRTLNCSSLATEGHTIPSADVDHDQRMTLSFNVCEQCGQDIPSDRISVHRRMCKPVSAGFSTFSALPHLRVRIGTGIGEKMVHKVSRKPPSVVCYICSREYGTTSISIHEPQCLKKWQLENSRLPLRDRKPLPKKPDRKVVARIVSREEDAAPVHSLPQAVYSSEVPDEVIERYFKHCYEEFEKELVPCSKCGRTFAPERYVKHAGRCKAKPLTVTSTKLKRDQ